jgi:hypothetical protein
MIRNTTAISDNTDTNDWPLGEFEKLDTNETASRSQMLKVPPDPEQMPRQSLALISGRKAKLDVLPRYRESARQGRSFCQSCRKTNKRFEVQICFFLHADSSVFLLPTSQA